MTMTAKELRQKYLDFFRSKDHAIIPSASLIPENDSSTLFISSGVQPLVPYVMGEKHPEGNRLADAQKCIRTIDIEEVGDSTHHTFFEMLGNWSLGDYFKQDAIKWSWEFLTSPKWLGLDKNLLAVSVFAGDEDAPFDQEAFDIWINLGMPESRIAKLGKNENWWGPPGKTGPCGPDTEIFYWVGDPNRVPDSFNDDNDLWVEIWNNVFIQFNKDENGNYSELNQKTVDTGMGLERMAAVMNGLDDDYKSGLFKDLIGKIEELSGQNYGTDKETTYGLRVVADHIKAAVFITGDEKGVAPSNTDQGYIVRRLIRRAMHYGRRLGIKEDCWIKEMAETVIKDYQDIYSELSRNHDFIISNLEEEEKKFGKALEKGIAEFKEMVNRKSEENSKKIEGKDAFYLYQSFGFPLEMTKEMAGQFDFDVDEEGFQEEYRKHQELSRTASAGKFKGGLADSGEETKKLHTAAHLLLAALRQVLGGHVSQKGSNITEERLRFDFSHPEKLTDEQKREVEKLVNEAIEKDLSVTCEEMPLEEAKANGATAAFEERYGEQVKVYSIGQGDDNFSYEICGGPHVDRTGELGYFRIKKEESSSAGVRRIKAVLEKE
jgi:alanyl-tRNA synthetase